MGGWGLTGVGERFTVFAHVHLRFLKTYLFTFLIQKLPFLSFYLFGCAGS